MNDRRETRAVGAWLALLADTMFLVAMTYACYHARQRVGDAGLAWPDSPGGIRIGATLPYVAAGLTLLAAGMLRLGLPRVIAFFALASSLSVMALFWHQAQQRGLSLRMGNYTAALYACTTVWTVHVLGALVYLGVRIRAVESPRILAVFLTVLGVLGGLGFSAILL